MDKVVKVVTDAVNGIVSVIIALIVGFVFAIILFPNLANTFDPIQGIIDLVNQFLVGGFAGLLALLVFIWFLEKK